MWRFHAFFTTADPDVLDTVTADKIHRGHAIIEQVHADLKSSALAHLPSGVFTANAAWLVSAVIAFNLTRAAATLAAPTSLPRTCRATTATVRRKLIQIPCRIATSARRLTLHLPQDWPWQTPGSSSSPASPTHQPERPADHPAGITGPTQTTVEHHWQRGQPTRHAHHAAAAHSAVRHPHAEATGGSGLRRAL